MLNSYQCQQAEGGEKNEYEYGNYGAKRQPIHSRIEKQSASVAVHALKASHSKAHISLAFRVAFQIDWLTCPPKKFLIQPTQLSPVHFTSTKNQHYRETEKTFIAIERLVSWQLEPSQK